MGYPPGLIVAGVLMGIAIFALKAGAGCGLASLNKWEVAGVSSLYVIAAAISGSVVGLAPQESIYNLLNLGVAFHLIISFALIGFGIHTIKKHTWGCDISRKTFLTMALPCPACLAALFLSIGMLKGYVLISGLTLGFGVGVFFFALTMASAMGLRRFASPENLGIAMLFLGMFYLASILLIPSYLKLRTVDFTGIAPPTEDMIMGSGLFGIFILLGFLRGRKRVYSRV
jgi:predicted transporter